MTENDSTVGIRNQMQNHKTEAVQLILTNPDPTAKKSLLAVNILIP